MIRKKKINSPQKNKINQQELLNYWSCFFKKWKQKNKHNKHIFFSHNIISDLFERRNSNTNSPPSSNTHLEYNETENYKKDETTKDKKNSNRTNEKLFLPALPHILNLPDNNSSDHSPHNIHYQRTPNTQKTISFPEKLIFAHPEKFGIVQEDKNDPNYTHVYLYRHKIALTPNELTQMEKNFMNYNKPKVYQLHNHVNTKKKKMLRCPLRSCQHKVLNNVYIKESLSQHCANYHNNDLKHYIFYYKINHKWETFFYPPLHLQNNPREQNPPTCQNHNNEISPLSTEQNQTNLLKKTSFFCPPLHLQNNPREQNSPTCQNQKNEISPISIERNQTELLKKTTSQTDKFLFNTQPVFSQSEQIFITPPPGLV